MSNIHEALLLTAAVLQAVAQARVAISESDEFVLNLPSGSRRVTVGEVLDIADRALEPPEESLLEKFGRATGAHPYT